jgi:iron complex transport system ATP-binding protein
MDLELSALHLAVGGRVLVDALEARCLPGQFWCVLGRNGAGKSTLLKTLAGLRNPDGGEIRLDQKPLARYGVRPLARCRAYLAQQVTDAFSASVLDTVMMARYPFHSSLAARLGFEGAADREIARGALQALGIDGWQQRDVLTLSGGERRLVAVATALAQDVALMFLDEPAAHLDVDICQRVFLALSRKVTEGACVVASVHDPDLAARYASHVLLLKPDGRHAVGPVAQVLVEKQLSETFMHRIQQVGVDGQRRFLTG